MKMITSTLTGLASSLFLNAGLTQAAQKLDPVSQQRIEHCPTACGAAYTTVSNFPAKQRK